MRASLAAAAVCSLTVERWKSALDGAGGHLDELHPPVGHDREALHHDAAGDDQVLVALLVAPGPVAAADEPRGEGSDQHDHHGR